MKYRCRAAHGDFPGNADALRATVPAHFRMEQPVAAVIYHVMQVQSLGAKHAAVDGVGLIAAQFHAAAPVTPDFDAAAHAAIRTNRTAPVIHDGGAISFS